MKQTSILLLFLISIFSFSQTPRLFLTPQRISELKAAIAVPGSHHNQLAKVMRDRLNNPILTVYGTESGNYLRSFKAVEAALMYKLTDSNKYAQLAYTTLTEMYTSGDVGAPTIPYLGVWATTNGSKALNYTFPAIAYGLCYDWARDGWNTSQKSYVLDSIKAGLNDWNSYFTWELYNMPVSNWVSVCRGAEIIMMLAASEETNRAVRYNAIKDSLRKHYRLAYGPSGYTYEGLGYMHYGVPFAMAAMYAARSIGDTSLNVCFNKIDIWKLLMYSFSFTPSGKHVMTSIDASGFLGEGLFGLVMGNLPDDSLKYYKYFYDRYCGVKSKLPVTHIFDNRRLGAVWNMIFYKESLPESNPNGIFKPVLADNGYGAYFFRNRFKNENDLIFDIMGKYKRHNSTSWALAETFNFSMTGYNTLYFGQCGKSYTQSLVSSLLVNNKAWGTQSKPERDTGYLESFENQPNGAYVIINGSQKYGYLGASSSRRHCLLNYFNDSMAVISTLDKMTSATSNTYTWQANIGNDSSAMGISVVKGTENSRPYFLLTGNNNSYVKGWCMNPSGISFAGTDPLTITTAAATSADLWIVMTVGTGTPPVATFTGSGLLTVANFSGKSVRFNSSANRITMSDLVSSPSLTAANTNNFIVYPNPSTGVINIEIPDDLIDIEIVDMTGRSILKNYNTSNKSFDLTGYSKGIYYVVISKDNYKQVEKIILK